INQRLQEIDRVSQQTQFNGVQVLGKDNNTLKVQVGANDNESISINLKRIDSSTLEMSGFQVEKTTTVKTVTSANIGAEFTSVTLAADTEVGSGITAEGLYALKDGSGYVVKGDDANYYAATLTITNGVASAAW